MKTTDAGRWGPWDPMRGARRQAEAIQEENSSASNTTNTWSKGASKYKDPAYKDAVRNPTRTKPEQMRAAKIAARKGLVKGSSPNAPDR